MYSIYIILFVILLILVACMTPSSIEKFISDDYIRISSGEYPTDGSCIQLAAEKGFINTKDTDQKTKERLSILADMEIARIEQTQFDSTVRPNVNACIFTDNAMNMYSTNLGKNKLDKSTCTLTGTTVNNQQVYHQLKPLGMKTNITPNGCMLDMDAITKPELDKFLDDAYHIKNYGDLKQIRDYENAMIELSKQNDDYKARTERAEEINRQYAEQYKLIRTNDRISHRCDTRYTCWQDVDDSWSYNFLDRHGGHPPERKECNLECKDDEVLNEFALELDTMSKPNKSRYKYRCCKMDSAPVPRKLEETKFEHKAPFQNSLRWDTMALVTQPISCGTPQDKENVNMLKGFVLEPQYINQLESNSRYKTKCSAFNVNTIPNRKVITKCRDRRTRSQPSSKTFNVLSKHAVSCSDGEGITDVQFKSDGFNSYYTYSCCKPEMIET